MAAEFLSARGARSGPILTYGYPGWTRISVEEQVVHGVPSGERVLRSGEVVTLDVAIELDGWTVSALDGSPSAHEEHTIMVADGGPVVLTRN